LPELPEIETIKNDTKKTLVGRQIKSVEILDPKPVKGQAKEFKDLRAKIKNIRRFAKILVLDLSNDQSILIHLKLTGQLVYLKDTQKIAGGHYEVGSLEVPNKFTRLIIHLDQGRLFFNDMRKFGWLKLIKTRDVEESREVKSLGIEPLAKNFTLDKFKEILQKRSKKPMKILLMDQNLISGIGNIYANEALFWAKIQPNRLAGSLSPKEIKALYLAIIKVLKEGIRLKGSSENTYVDLFGRKGGFVKKTMVYQKEGEKCKLCGGKIVRQKQGGRSSFYCPACQR